MTSGMTSGALTMPANTARPRNRGKRSSVNAASVPRRIEPVAVAPAIFSERNRP